MCSVEMEGDGGGILSRRVQVGDKVMYPKEVMYPKVSNNVTLDPSGPWDSLHPSIFIFNYSILSFAYKSSIPTPLTEFRYLESLLPGPLSLRLPSSWYQLTLAGSMWDKS